MNDFEKLWRNKISHYTEQTTDKTLRQELDMISDEDPVDYSRSIIKCLKAKTSKQNVKDIFACSACHLPHVKLEEAKNAFQETHSISKARMILEESFKADIKFYKNLTDSQVQDIIEKGWGLAGVLKDNKIIATKIPSMFHEYFNETDEVKKKYYYCHCPRVRKELLANKDLDSIYCYCGGGFYKDVWEYITDKPVQIKVLKTLFHGHDTCQFEISFN